MISQSHFDAFVNQERPTLAALPGPAGFVLAPIAPNCQPLKYARPDFVNQVRPTLAALPAPAGFELCFVAPLAQPQEYAKSDVVSQSRPTFAILPSPAGFELCFVARPAQPFDYAQGFIVEPDKALSTPAITFLPGWMSTDGKPAVVLTYSEGDSFSFAGVVTVRLFTTPNYSQVRLGGTPPVPGSLLSSQFLSSIVAAPTIPVLVYTNDGRPAVVLAYAESDVSTQIGPTLATLPGFVERILTSQKAVALAYAKSDVVAQLNPTLAALPTFSDLVLSSQRARVSVYAFSDAVLVLNLPTVTTVVGGVQYSQFRTGGVGPVPTSYQAGVLALQQVAAPAPSTFGQWMNFDGATRLKANFVRGDVNAPDKMVAVTPASPTLAQWLTTNGLAAVMLRYFGSTFVGPDKAVVAAAATTIFTKPDYSQVRLGGTPPVPRHVATFSAPIVATASQTIPLGVSFESTDGQKAIVLVYTQPSVTGPDKAAVTVAVTFLSGWLSTDSKPSLPLTYSGSSVTGVDKANLVAAAQAFLPGWMSTDGQKSVKYIFAKSDWSAPDKMTGQAVVVPIYAWRGEDPYVPKWDWYAMGDTYSGPATTATAQQAFASANLAASALPARFRRDVYTAPILPIATAPLSLFVNGLADITPSAQPQQYSKPPELNAPDKFGQTAVAATFLPGWLSTDGSLAIILKYLRGDVSAPDKFGQVAAAQTFLPGWMSTDGALAVLLDYVKSDTFVGPDKANLVTPATTFLSQWLATLGNPAVVLRYPRPEALNLPLQSLLFAVSRSMGTPYEALGRIANSKTINYEALGQLRKAAVTNYEALSRMSSALKSNYEFLKGLNQSRGVNEELLKGLFPSRVSNYEAKGTVVRQLTANYEASGRVFAQLTKNYEVLKGAISQTKVSPYELLKGIAALEKTFEEARGLVKSLGLSRYEVRLLGLAFSLALDSAKLFQALTVTNVLAGDQLDEAINSASVVPALTVKNVIVGS